DLNITSGTLSSGGNAIALSGNWSNSGTFNHNNSTVTLDGGDQTITGSNNTAFYNLEKSTTSPRYTARGFAYGLTADYGATTTETGDFAAGDFTFDISSLACGTTYHYQAFAAGPLGTSTGPDQTFTTAACAIPDHPSSGSASHVSGGGSVSIPALASILAPGAAADAYLHSLKEPVPGCPLGLVCMPQSTPILTVTLARNSEGPDVMALQVLLSTLGFFKKVAPNGYFGPVTEEAVKSYQAAKGIDPIGIVGPMTMAALNDEKPIVPEAPTTPTPNLPALLPDSSALIRDLEAGATGDDVRTLQMYLNAKGYAVSLAGPGSPGSETTLFGPKTKAALMTFQRDHGIPATGFFGPITREYVAAH
ncbi:MAG: peptidoglycan DL-endopeptidase LytF, partial [Candidatus Parcubacteria bacterium]|nr:peptidoglycan DL-endopeptidase LytF [Candidatus Parcubacteria bacterium]